MARPRFSQWASMSDICLGDGGLVLGVLALVRDTGVDGCPVFLHSHHAPEALQGDMQSTLG